MDTAVEKSCLEEISHTVLDAQEKIFVRAISNNYGLGFPDAVAILQKWIDRNGAKASLSREFIVRGVYTKQNKAFIVVAVEGKLDAIRAKAEQVSAVLYSVEMASKSSRTLGVPSRDHNFKVINLPLKTDKRDVKVFKPADPPATIKQETKPKINSMFAASSSKPKQEPPKPVVVKEEKQSPPATVKQEPPAAKVSPQKTSPPKTASSPSKKKDAKKPVATGKSSIASFFSNKPAAAPPAKPAPTAAASTTKVEVKQEKPSPKESPKQNGKEAETARWKRLISDDESDEEVVPSTPQPEKKDARKAVAKKGPVAKKGKGKANPTKRSRILQAEDSSEDEEEDAEMREEPEERLVKIDIADSEEEEEQKRKEEPSPEKHVENDSNSLNRKKAKVKKLVTKTFMDEEGYLTTIKEYEMVSASEDEGENGSKSNGDSAEAKTVTPKESAKGKAVESKKEADKKPSKVTPPTPKTKQGSIMSFFSKK